jgi:hypothetical protein
MHRYLPKRAYGYLNMDLQNFRKSLLFAQTSLLFAAEFFSLLEKHLLTYFYMFFIRVWIEASAAYFAPL